MKTKIISDPKILGGKPIIAGTRVAVETVMNLLAAGLEVKEILSEYPHLTKEDVASAIEFATQIVKREEILPALENNGMKPNLSKTYQANQVYTEN